MSLFNREMALWGSVYLAVLVSLLTPLGAVSALFIMLPLTILYVRQSSNSFFIVYAIALAVALALAGGAGFVLFAISVFFLIASGIMGHLYKTGASAAAVITAGTVTLIIESLLTFLGASLFGYNIYKMFHDTLTQSLTTLNSLAEHTLSAEMIRQYADLMADMIPVLLIMSCLLLTVFTHWLARATLNRYGINVSGLPPIREWMLPKSFVWYYLLTLSANLFIPSASHSIWAVILANLLPLLSFAFAVQGISFLSHFAAVKGWGKALPATGIVLAFFFTYLISMLGLVDIAFNLRKHMKNQI